MRSRHVYVALVMCILCFDPSGVGAQATRHHALLIGHNAPPADRSDLPTLSYADDDALRFFELLRLAKARTILLASLDGETRRRYPRAPAEPPTPSALRRALQQLGRRVATDLREGVQPVVFLTYSGHGARDEDGELYLTLAGGKLTRHELLERVLPALRGAHVHLFIDACHAGALVASRGGLDEAISVPTVEVDPARLDSVLARPDLTALPGVGAFLAAAPNAEAHEWSRVQSGVFTHEIVSGLYGAADINGDLRIDYGELQAFVASANSRLDDPRARPQLVVRAPHGDTSTLVWDLSALSNVRWLTGDASRLGRFRVERQGGGQLLEAHVGPSVRVALALPADRDTFILSGGHEAHVSRGAPGLVRFSELRLSERGTASRSGALDRSLHRYLFAQPYTPVYYRGFMDSRGLPSVAFGAPLPLPGERPDTHRPPSSRALRRVLWVGALTMAAGAVGSGAVALRAAREHGGASQRRARELDLRYRRAGPVALGLTAATVALGFTAWWLRPARRSVEVSVGRQVRVRARW